MPRLRIGSSTWLAGAAGRSPRTFPTLRGQHRTEVAIVGGGLTGAAAALTFAEAGIDVVVLERGLVGRGSTAASTALLLREPDAGLVDLSRRYGSARARRIWELGGAAVDAFVETVRRLGIDCDLRETDAVHYTRDREAARLMAREHRRRRAAGIEGEWLGAGAVRRLTAIPARAAIRTRRNAELDPYRACLGMMDAAAARGARVFESSRVSRIERTRAGVRLRTPRGSVSAATVVIATGYATADFRPLAGRFRLNHTYVIATEPMTRKQRRELGLDRVLLWDTKRPYHYARWTAEHRLLMGGADRPLLSGSARHAAFHTGTTAVREYFEDILPALADVPIDRAWEGIFAVTADGLPYIGPHRRYPRHLFALGYGGNGMTFGFLAARLLLERHRGGNTEDEELFGFGRHR